MHNALEKEKATGADIEEGMTNTQKSNFMVVDMRKKLGTMVQLITPSVAKIYNLLINAGKIGTVNQISCAN